MSSSVALLSLFSADALGRITTEKIEHTQNLREKVMCVFSNSLFYSLKKEKY